MIDSLDRITIDHFRDTIAQRLGLQFDDSKRDFLGEVLQRRIEQTNSSDAFSYFKRLTAELSAAAEAIALAEDLTVGETYFFRHPDQFRAFKEVALLPRLHSRTMSSRLRILSAGCASGEEAHSAAILLLQHGHDVSRWAAPVVGIDINAAALAKAAKAQYSSWSLRGMSEEIRQSYFRGDKVFVLDDSVRSLVSFKNCNLVDEADDFWQRDQFDVIFCRNVIMYFAPEAARAVIARLTRSLVHGGLLFLGPAETLRGISQDYHLRHTHETFYYQRRSPEERPTDTPPDVTVRSPLFGNYLPILASEDTSWVDAISQASDRIARLSREMSTVKSVPDEKAVIPPRNDCRPDLRAVREMVRQERFTEALGLLHSLSVDEGKDPDVQLLHAVILTNCGEVAEAERLCNQVLVGDNLNAEAHYLLALCQEHRKEYAAAVEQDETALYLDPQFAMPHLHLGLLKKRMGDWQAAQQAFQKAQSLLPREDSARILLFGGGFSREMLIDLCKAEIVSCRGTL